MLIRRVVCLVSWSMSLELYIVHETTPRNGESTPSSRSKTSSDRSSPSTTTTSSRISKVTEDLSCSLHRRSIVAPAGEEKGGCTGEEEVVGFVT